ncbi:type-F conjugative transfer system protein TraW [Candidatus Protochlamydia sp. R18]|uniref:type-F conjugative transfer system protein TraW n=1 Tax=Candidatus Protochlamydia sp. R18 TaxID=1353977 RepID=UPI0005A806B8|nr:type-F conjugative transfer system protein TraW [Candidatus Protochlamydia sp. R18]
MPPFLTGILTVLLIFSSLEAKNLGIYGATASIEEEDLLTFMQKNMQLITEADQEKWMQNLQSHLLAQMKKPFVIKGIGKTQTYTVSYFDPSITVDRDILNHSQQVVVKKGTRINPLSLVMLDQDLLFIDATDAEQLAWAQALYPSGKWILVKGQPMQLEEELRRPIYFDQGGVLLKRFGIQSVPARVSQEGLRLKIELIPIGENACVPIS